MGTCHMCVVIPQRKKYVKTPGQVLFGRKLEKLHSVPDKSKASHQQYGITPVRICPRRKVQQSFKPTPPNKRKSGCLPSYAMARSGLHRRSESKQWSDKDLRDIPICILLQLSSRFISFLFAAVNCGNDDPFIPMDCLASD